MVVRKWELGNSKTQMGSEFVQSYKDLEVYRQSYEQAKRLYALSAKYPKVEQYALASQVRRAAVSIPLNIAEGYGKVETGKELLRYLSMARGSSAELEVLLDFSKDFGYISEEEYTQAKEVQEQVGKMLTGLIRSIRSRF